MDEEASPPTPHVQDPGPGAAAVGTADPSWDGGTYATCNVLINRSANTATILTALTQRQRAGLRLAASYAATTAVVTASLLAVYTLEGVDFAYVRLDPRIRLGR